MSRQNSRLVDQLADAPRCSEMRFGRRPHAIVFRYLRGLHGYSRAGVSLVEMMVAVALLSIISITALQLVRITETEIVGSQITLGNQQQSESVMAYIYKDFAQGRLQDDVRSRVYTNDNMSADLKAGAGVTVVSLFGMTSRYDGVDPRCPLVETANLAAGTFKMNATCMDPGSPSILLEINKLIQKGITVTTGLEGGVGRCSISTPVTIDQVTGIATLTVDDPSCVATGGNPPTGVPAGNHVFLPRFVAYDTNDPRLFHTSMIEPPDPLTTGIGLDMPAEKIVQGGGVSNVADFVFAVANDLNTDITVRLETEHQLSRLTIPNPPADVSVSNNRPNQVQISGKVPAVRQALLNLNYASPDNYFSTDGLMGKISDGMLVASGRTNLDVKPNCGGQKDGTALLFALGNYDSDGAFREVSYVTSVSVAGKKLPVHFYGYCGLSGGSVVKFDQPDGGYSPIPPGDNMSNHCANAKRELSWIGDVVNPANYNYRGFPYVKSAPMYREGYSRREHITVYLYENFMDTVPVSTTGINNDDATTLNRYSLIFQFDTFDTTSGQVSLQLDNIEANRNLRDINDPFTFLDDPRDFQTSTIGQDGRLITNASWQFSNDGVIVPLRLGTNAYDPNTGLYELGRYSQDPDGDGNSDPSLKMTSWQGLVGWNVRATNIQTQAVEWQQIPFQAGGPDARTGISLKISRAQRCPK